MARGGVGLRAHSDVCSRSIAGPEQVNLDKARSPDLAAITAEITATKISLGGSDESDKANVALRMRMASKTDSVLPGGPQRMWWSRKKEHLLGFEEKPGSMTRPQFTAASVILENPLAAVQMGSDTDVNPEGPWQASRNPLASKPRHSRTLSGTAWP